jgi:hypothetical protein
VNQREHFTSGSSSKREVVPRKTLNPAHVSESLVAAGFRCRPSDVQIEAREERWLVRLPGQRVAWFAASSSGLERLRAERRVLRLLEARCSFGAPRVLFESRDEEFDVRTMVPGTVDPWAVYAETRDDTRRSIQLGTAIGAILAEQHSRISASDVREWLPAIPSWPEPRDWISERLPSVVGDADLIARAGYVMEAYESVSLDQVDRALVHTDVGFHNLGIDPQSFAVHGIFDYDGAAWADRHHDFRYLVFALDRYEMLEAATSVYEPVVGRPIRRDRVLLYNAACAISYLAYRAGTEPEERSCGRTLAEDLRWSKHAIAKALPSAK